jgi:hypothetical protein
VGKRDHHGSTESTGRKSGKKIKEGNQEKKSRREVKKGSQEGKSEKELRSSFSKIPCFPCFRGE